MSAAALLANYSLAREIDGRTNTLRYHKLTPICCYWSDYKALSVTHEFCKQRSLYSKYPEG